METSNVAVETKSWIDRIALGVKSRRRAEALLIQARKGDDVRGPGGREELGRLEAVPAARGAGPSVVE